MAATQGWVAVNTTDVNESILHSSEIQAYRLGNGADTTIVPWKFGETLGEAIARAEALQVVSATTARRSPDLPTTERQS